MIQGTGLTVPGILHRVDVTGPAGQVTGIIGPNGAGKSTLLGALSLLRSGARGTVSVHGAPINDLSDRARARLMALVAQHTTLDFDFTARDVVAFGRHPHRGRFERESERDRDHVTSALERVGASRFADRPVTHLSGGENQLTQIARAIAQDVPVLLLDEPVSALDLRHELIVLTLLRELAEEGRTVITVLHDLSQAARFCDRLVLVADGCITATGTPDQVLTPATIAGAYGVHTTVRTNPDTGSVTVTALHPQDKGVRS